MSRKNQQQQTEQQAITTAFGATSLLGKRIAAAEEAARKAQEAARELRETMAEAQDVSKSIRAGETRLRRLAENEVSEILEAEVTRQVGMLGEKTEEQMHRSVAKVSREFDKLEKAFLGEEREDGRPSIRDLVAQIELVFGIKWERFLAMTLSALEVANGCVDVNCDMPASHALLVNIQPANNGGKRARGHLHLCAAHTEEMRATGTVVKTVSLPTQMCPWPHEGKTLLDFKDTEGCRIYNTEVYGELDLPEEVQINAGGGKFLHGTTRRV